MTEFYNCRKTDGKDFQLTKFDKDLNIVMNDDGPAIYETSQHGCTCKAGHKTTCRHRQMLVRFQTEKHVGDGWMLDWHTGLWWQPKGAGDLLAEMARYLQGSGVAGPGEEILPGVTAFQFAERPIPAADGPHPASAAPVQSVSDTAARPAGVERPPSAPPAGTTTRIKRRFG